MLLAWKDKNSLSLFLSDATAWIFHMNIETATETMKITIKKIRIYFTVFLLMLRDR